MNNLNFDKKWKKINESKNDADEKTLFVDIGEEPRTQRQLNLYYYYLFIKNILNGIQAINVLEVGCGRGTMSLFLSKHTGLKTFLLDESSDAIEIVRKEFIKYNQEGEYYISDALNTKLEAKRFDSVISIGLAEHFKSSDVAE